MLSHRRTFHSAYSQFDFIQSEAYVELPYLSQIGSTVFQFDRSRSTSRKLTLEKGKYAEKKH